MDCTCSSQGQSNGKLMQVNDDKSVSTYLVEILRFTFIEADNRPR